MKYLIILLAAFISFGCHKKPEVALDVNDSSVIPLPRKMEPINTSFVIDKTTTVYTSEDASAIAQEFVVEFNKRSGLSLEIRPLENGLKSNAIYFIIEPLEKLKEESEAYSLSVSMDRIVLQADESQGVYRGYQSLFQLLPFEAITTSNFHGFVWAVPGVHITDSPKYEYRGAMLDVARHFFTVSDVKRYIDLLALHKINTLHLHLTDDQGWRIEIKSWPKLTQIGGKTAIGGGKGGYYTQDDYKEIVSYAASKYITIIPEIDMPGHTNAALAAYPELSCDGKPRKMYTGMRVGFSTLCVDKEITYTFVNDVMRELSVITPGDYIHLGGDESHVTEKEDYNIFLSKVFQIVQSHGKKVMGWEDIQSAGINDTMIIQHWTDTKKANNGGKQGARIVLSPAPRMYLDMKYNDSTKLGLKWAGTIDLTKAYDWNPERILDPNYSDQIVGLESPLWTETIETIEDIEFMAFPRILAHSELGWNGLKNKTTLSSKIKTHLKLLDQLEVNYNKTDILEPGGR